MASVMVPLSQKKPRGRPRKYATVEDEKFMREFLRFCRREEKKGSQGLFSGYSINCIVDKELEKESLKQLLRRKSRDKKRKQRESDRFRLNENERRRYRDAAMKRLKWMQDQKQKEREEKEKAKADREGKKLARKAIVR